VERGVGEREAVTKAVSHQQQVWTAYSMNLVGSTYSTGFMIAKGYFGSFTVLP
jgi:hypothetical protein